MQYTEPWKTFNLELSFVHDNILRQYTFFIQTHTLSWTKGRYVFSSVKNHAFRGKRTRHAFSHYWTTRFFILKRKPWRFCRLRENGHAPLSRVLNATFFRSRKNAEKTIHVGLSICYEAYTVILNSSKSSLCISFTNQFCDNVFRCC